MRSDDLIHLSALLQLCDDSVNSCLHLPVVLLDGYCVGILEQSVACKDLKSVIGSDQLKRRSLIHNDAVDLAVQKILCCLDKLGVALYRLRRSVLADPQVCDVALLNTDNLAFQCIRGDLPC